MDSKNVSLNDFSLKELKEIFKNIQVRFGILCNYKVYSLCKFDLITILNNSNFFIQKYPLYMLFKFERHQYKLYPMEKKSMDKGEKITQIKKSHGKYIVSFS